MGITTKDPLGLGPASSTFSGLIGMETYSAIHFRKLVTNPIYRNNGVRVIVGGPGAWQLADERIAAKLGIDCVVVGEGEITGVEIFERALKGDDLPRVVEGEIVPLDRIPSIKNPTINGIVEIARGCGRGCDFCIPTLRKLRYLPIEKIVEEVKINTAAGLSILLHAEDVLRYGTKNLIPEEEKVMRLFEEVSKFSSDINISHFTFTSVYARPRLVKWISEFFGIPNDRKPWFSGQVGLETGSPELMEKHMRGKVAPFKPKEWPEVVIEAHEALAENHWVPCSTLIMGLPGESADDVIKTIELVKRLEGYRSLVVPLFYVPFGFNDGCFFKVEDMLPEHWMLIAACWKHDLKWARELADDHLRGWNPLKRFVLKKLILGTLGRVVKRYLKLMEEGMSPSSDRA